ncbi:MAG: PDZ domain-containing protein [Bacteroidales bacterium]
MKSKFYILFLSILLIVITSVKIYGQEEKKSLPEGAIPVLYDGLIYLKASADSVPGNFIIDTGAEKLYYDSTFFVYSDLQYNNILPARISGAGQSYQDINVIYDDVVFNYYGNIFIANVVPIINLKPLLGEYVDGIIGTDCFQNKVLMANFKEQYIKLYSSIDYIDTRRWKKIKLLKDKNKLLVPLDVKINKDLIISGNFLLDLGAKCSIIFTSKLAEKYNLYSKIKKKKLYYTKYGGLGGVSSSYEFNSRFVKINKYRIRRTHLAYSLDTLGSLSNQKWEGIIGNDILDYFDIIIDFINDDLYIRPDENFYRKRQNLRLGFTYADRGKELNSWVVTGLYSSSNAEKAGLKIDDQIFNINGVNVINITHPLQKKFLEDIKDFDMLIQRRDSIINLKFRAVRMF